MKAFDSGLLFWTLLTFGCLFLLLVKFAFKPLRKILNQREQTIRDSLQQAEKARDEAEKLLARNEEQQNKAREDTRRIIGEGHRIVADMKREAHQQAKAEADTIVAQARSEIDRELQRSLEDLKGTVSNLSLRIARTVIKENMDQSVHDKMADDFIERLKKSHAR